ncbi:heterokaryon incompatibility protein-domain-containing protein [Alternaria rosae]|uniref:heterokaryon incompatibility protein-domain-containing protein n=1 Tax=Alternaria rosae TaxID=1187941 RepID=UPI001E8E4AED|nr:heterokaryon incompatibility protein-domain-containing protein [Alternaria rosae]KAH6876261.1 heterokaryon incompatibility protein-domain-containing protein [Alternaria rosae]
MTECLDNEAPMRMDSQDDSVPEGSVPLHRLCDRCRQMFDTWDKTCEWFGGTMGLEPSRGYERYELCTLTEMMNSRQSCHLCEMLYSQIKQDDGIPLHKPIVCQIGPSFRGTLHISTRGISLLLDGYVISSDCISVNRDTGEPRKPIGFPSIAKHIPRLPTDNLVQVQKWLQTCRAHHGRCNNWFPRLDTKGRRPTRILELYENGVRLRCDPEVIDNFEYLALSHMWGEDPSTQLLLTATTLQEFQEAIPMNKLSSIFTEAIRITRSLGFSYLWLDSLCIIQGSASDWTNEANMMSAVYNNAVCTIAFLFPPDVGFCRARDDPRASTPCVVRRHIRDIWIFPKEENPSRCASINWPLSSRAWVLQEQLLSPRTILYGHRTIMWECGNSFWDELGLELTHNSDRDRTILGPVALKPTLRMNRYNLSHTSESIRAGLGAYCPFVDWARLIREYRRRELSRASDRIMAIVGTARAFQSEYGFTYLAGMWREHLPRSLLWYIETANVRKMAKPFLIQELPSNPVPTWSWLAGPIYKHCGVVVPGGSSEIWDPQLFVAKFLHFKWSNRPVNHAPPTAYYDFDSLQITLELATHMTTILLQEPHGEHDCHRLRYDSLEKELACCLGLGREHLAAFYHCDDLETLYQPPTEVRIALIAEEVDLNFRHDLQGLALAPGVESGTWKRLGYWKAWVDPGDDIWGTKSVFLRLEGVKIETLTLV